MILITGCNYCKKGYFVWFVYCKQKAELHLFTVVNETFSFHWDPAKIKQVPFMMLQGHSWLILYLCFLWMIAKLRCYIHRPPPLVCVCACARAPDLDALFSMCACEVKPECTVCCLSALTAAFVSKRRLFVVHASGAQRAAFKEDGCLSSFSLCIVVSFYHRRHLWYLYASVRFSLSHTHTFISSCSSIPVTPSPIWQSIFGGDNFGGGGLWVGRGAGRQRGGQTMSLCVHIVEQETS